MKGTTRNMDDQTDISRQNDDETLIMLFRRTVKFMARAHHGSPGGHCQHAQAHILAILQERGTVNQKELMEMLHVRSASMSEILMKLERSGFISRTRSEQDKRNFVITVTEEGAAAAGEYKKEFLKRLRGFFSPLDDVERQQLGGILRKIITSLEESSPADEHCRGHRGPGIGHGHFHQGRCRRFHHHRHDESARHGSRTEE